MFERLPADFRALAAVLVTLAITAFAAWLVQRILARALARYSERRQIDEIGTRFVRRLVIAGIYLIGVSTALTHIPEFRTLGHSLLAGAGILTIVGGLASQQVLSNIVSGFLIVLFRPFKTGDRITVNNTWTGVVEDITLRETILRDFENNRVVVPNAVLSGQVLVNANHTDERICKFIEIGIGYRSDVDRAMAIMAEEITKHPLHIDHRSAEQVQRAEPIVPVRVMSLGSSSVNLRAWAWADNPADGFVLQCDLLRSIKQRFDAENIEIPFPQTTLTFGKDEVLAVSTNKN